MYPINEYDPTVASLIARVDRLERQNIWLRRGAIGLFSVVVFLAAFFIADNNKIRSRLALLRDQSMVTAEMFALKDKDGKLRSAWFIEDDGTISLSMKDKNEKTRLALGIDSEQGGPYVSLRNSSQEELFKLLLMGDEGASIAFADGSGDLRLLLGADEQASPHLILLDDAETARIRLDLPDNKGAAISMNDRSGNTRLGLFADNSGQPSVNLMDDRKKLCAYLSEVEGNYVLSLNDEDDSSVYISTGEAGSITTRGRNGINAWP